MISDSSLKLHIVNFISSLTKQSSQLFVYSSHTPECITQSDHSVLPSATPPSTLHKIPLLQHVSALVREEVIVVTVMVLLGFVAVCCSLWCHGNSGSTNQSGFSFHIPSTASSTPQPLPPILMSTLSTTPPGSSPRQPHHRAAASTFTPTNNSPHYTVSNLAISLSSMCLLYSSQYWLGSSSHRLLSV